MAMGPHKILEMTNMQIIFTVTYSILYGIMLDSCGGLNLFPFAWLYAKEQPHVGKRIIFAFLLIVLSPIASFALIYSWLNDIGHVKLYTIRYDNLFLNAGIVFSIFLISQIVFAFYRVFHILIVDCNLYDKKLKKIRNARAHIIDRKYFRKIGQESMIDRFIKFGPNNSGQYLATYLNFLYTYYGFITIRWFDEKLTSYSFTGYYLMPISFFIVTLLANRILCENQRKGLYILNGLLLFILFFKY